MLGRFGDQVLPDMGNRLEPQYINIGTLSDLAVNGSISQMTSVAVDVKNEVDESITAGEIPSLPMTKSSIIDQELNRHGMGRYQWCASSPF